VPFAAQLAQKPKLEKSKNIHTYIQSAGQAQAQCGEVDLFEMGIDNNATFWPTAKILTTNNFQLWLSQVP